MDEMQRAEFIRQEQSRQASIWEYNHERYCPNCSGRSPSGGYCAACMAILRATEHPDLVFGGGATVPPPEYELYETNDWEPDGRDRDDYVSAHDEVTSVEAITRQERHIEVAREQYGLCTNCGAPGGVGGICPSCRLALQAEQPNRQVGELSSGNEGASQERTAILGVLKNPNGFEPPPVLYSRPVDPPPGWAFEPPPILVTAAEAEAAAAVGEVAGKAAAVESIRLGLSLGGLAIAAGLLAVFWPNSIAPEPDMPPRAPMRMPGADDPDSSTRVVDPSSDIPISDPPFLVSPVVEPGRPPEELHAASLYRRIWEESGTLTYGPYVIHHAIEQQVLRRYPNLFTEEEMQALSNLRAIPNEINREVHLSLIRNAWDGFYRDHDQTPPSRKEVLQYAAKVDRMLDGVIIMPSR